MSGNHHLILRQHMSSFRPAPCVFLLLFILASTTGCGSEASQKTIKLGHGLDTNHPVHKAMVFMAERVAEKSNGTMRVDIYPSQQLGTERELLELLQIGSLAMTKVSGSVMENFAPSYKVMSLPYMFRDDAHKFEIFEGDIGRELLVQSEEFRLRGLTFYDAGSRSFYTINKPVHSPSDLDGLKIRVQESITSMKMVNTLGGSATPIAWGELYTALQQGVVDGAENNPPSFYTSRHYEIAKYYSLDEHTAVPDVLIMSTVVWNSLTPEQQNWVQEAANESAQEQKRLWREATEEAMREVQEAGVEIIRPDKSTFVEQVSEMIETYRTEEPEIYALIERIRASGPHPPPDVEATDDEGEEPDQEQSSPD